MKRKEQAEVEPRSCQETNKRRETQQKQEENQKGTKNNKKRKKRKQTKTTTKTNTTKGTADKQARSSYLTLWWKVLMLNQKLVRDCLELLLGKPSASVQMN